MSFIEQLPPRIYISLLVFAIILVVIPLIFNYRTYPKPYVFAFIFFIIASILLIILKLAWLNNIRKVLTFVTMIFFLSGLLTFFISGYLYNKRNGVKLDKTIRNIIIACVILVIIGLVMVILALYMKSQ